MSGTSALLLDLDGVILLRDRLLPGAAEAIARLDAAGVPYAIATNTSLVSRATLSRELARAGLPIPPEIIVTASSAAAGHCRRRFDGEPLYVMGAPDALVEFAGLNLLDHDAAAEPGSMAAAVVVGDAAGDFTPRNLQSAFTLIRGGARLLAMHKNRWWFTPEGVRMDAGGYVAALEFATERRAVVTGKPSRAFLRAGLDILTGLARGSRGVARSAVRRRSGPLLPGNVAMVGDDLWNDLRGAQRAGMRSVFVRSGKHGDAELARYSRESGGPPDADAPSIGEVVEALLG